MEGEIPRLEEIHSTVNEWIRFADAKAGATLTLSAIGGTLVANDLIQPSPSDSTAITVLLAGSGAAALATLGMVLWALAPVVRPRDRRCSHFYFGHISQHSDHASYLAAFRQTLEAEELAEHIAHQIYENSRIALNKMKVLGWAMRLIALQFLLGFLALGVRVVEALNGS